MRIVSFLLLLTISSLLFSYTTCIDTESTPIIDGFVSDQPTSDELIQSAPDTPSQYIQDAINTLSTEYNGNVKVSISSGTQVAEMVEILHDDTDHGSRRRLLQTTLTPEEKAQLWFQQHGSIFGMQVGEYNGLQLTSNIIDNTTGHVHLVYEQYVDNIPVFGGRMNVHFDNEIQISAVNGNYIRDFAPVNTTAALSIDEGVYIAKQFLTKFRYNDINESSDDTFEDRFNSLQLYNNATLMIFRYGLLQNVPGNSVLTYKIILYSLRIRHVIYVNAHTGDIVEEYQDKHEVINRVTQRYDKATSRYITVWTEGQALTGNAAYDTLTDTARQTYNFFGSLTKGSWLSFNGADIKMTSVLDESGALMSCPNAMFDGSKAIYCTGTTADDVVSHEWGHGYTGYTSGLVYKYQQGAMNEAISDIWGETVDQLNGVGTDTPNNIRTTSACVSDWRTNVRWLMGEDATAFGGPIRDMWNPECKGAPAKVTSAYYRCGTSDSGGVHTNSGVVNRLYSLLVDGGTFNGQTVTGIGFQKASHLIWQVGRYYLTSVSAFPALASSLPSACRDLVGIPLPNLVTTDPNTWAAAGTGPAITTTDCAQVDKASIATELRLQPNCNFGFVINTAAYPLCPVSTQVNYDLFFDDFESRSLNTNGWSTTSVGVKSSWNRRNWVSNALGDGREGYGVFAADPDVGDCNTNDQSGVMRLISKTISVSQGAGGIRVSFEHYYTTENLFDGGNVQIEINGGSPQVIDKSLFLYNGYPYTLATDTPGYNTNPMRGQQSYTGAASSGGPQGAWVRSVIDLSSLVKVGDNFKLSFQFGSDGCGGVIGWYVDDVRIYWCGTDFCATNPCFNGGTCTNNAAAGTRTCTCPSGFSGADCSTINAQSRTYSWVQGDWSACTVSCGTGTATRSVTCQNDLGATVADSFCLTYAPSVLKPSTTQSCNTQSCPPSWHYSDWSGCSVTCGSGVITRVATCQTSTGVVVDDSLCASLQKESLSQSCTLSPCPVYVWNYGPWTTCSKTCGSGTHTRVASCINQATQVPTTADQCSGQPESATSEACNTQTCATWVYTEWSTCSAQCNGGTQTRTATCQYSNGNAQANTAECGTRDILTRTCNEAACITYAWRYTGWSECSAACGTGTQTRTNACVGSNGVIATDTSLCGTSDVLSRSCNTQDCRTYQWVYAEWGTCDKECGIGFRSRTVTCKDDLGNTAAYASCKDTLLPLTERCNTDPCVTYHYTYGEWTTCPVTCGGATQTRTIGCAGADGASVDISLCTGTPESSSQSCNTNPCISYSWQYADWGACSVNCGGGTETRTVICMGNDGSIADSEARCTEEKQSTTRACATSPCVSYSWVYSEWSTCSNACGTGTQSRTARCQDSAGNTVANTLCTDTQDSLTNSCTGSNCPVSVEWYTTPWSSCDVLCGSGSIRRSVFCVQSGSLIVVPDAQCTATVSKPAVTQPCNTSPCVNTVYKWYTFAWSRCSANCNTGYRSRSVVCVDQLYRIYSNSYCDASTKPAATEQCNTQSCSKRWRVSEWSVCSAQCGTGTHTRTVECTDDTGTTTLSESDCNSVGEKPTETESCNTQSCPKWSDEPFGACSANCGTGTQTRGVAKCLDYTGTQVDNSQCTDTAPVTTRTCNSQVCASYSWRTLDWSPCSSSCGGGVSTRQVRCYKQNGQMWIDAFCTLQQAGVRPDSTQVCNTQPCGTTTYTGVWWTSVWYACNNGVQTRDTVCIDSRYYQIDDSQCNAAARPIMTRSC